MIEETAELLDERGRWRARDVKYLRGTVDRIVPLMPKFELQDFTVGKDSAINPYMVSVVRMPLTIVERSIAVGVVSKSYTLVQHAEFAARCLKGLELAGVNISGLTCDLGLTELGEWMNLRVYLPESYNHDAGDKKPLRLRLECFNSVDGSNRLVVYFGWLRFVCSNGLVIGETKAEVREIHNPSLDLDEITYQIADGMAQVKRDRERLAAWSRQSASEPMIRPWADGPLATEWGPKAACRTYHICTSGQDVEVSPPFAEGPATSKPVKPLGAVPGAAIPARTAYDVSQALSWVATRRNNPDERVEWQLKIPHLINKLLEPSRSM